MRKRTKYGFLNAISTVTKKLVLDFSLLPSEMLGGTGGFPFITAVETHLMQEKMRAKMEQITVHQLTLADEIVIEIGKRKRCEFTADGFKMSMRQLTQ